MAANEKIETKTVFHRAFPGAEKFTINMDDFQADAVLPVENRMFSETIPFEPEKPKEESKGGKK